MRYFDLRGRSGFSFVELFIVMALIGTLIALAMPSFTSSIPYFKLRGATRRLAAHLRLARQVAIDRRVTTRVEFVTGSSPSYRIFTLDGSDTTYVKSPLTHRRIYVSTASGMPRGGRYT